MRRASAALLVALAVAAAGCGRNENEQGTPGDDPQAPAERQEAPTITTE